MDSPDVSRPEFDGAARKASEDVPPDAHSSFHRWVRAAASFELGLSGSDDLTKYSLELLIAGMSSPDNWELANLFNHDDPYREDIHRWITNFYGQLDLAIPTELDYVWVEITSATVRGSDPGQLLRSCRTLVSLSRSVPELFDPCRVFLNAQDNLDEHIVIEKSHADIRQGLQSLRAALPDLLTAHFEGTSTAWLLEVVKGSLHDSAE